MPSLTVINESYGTPERQLGFGVGEPNGGSPKPHIEWRRQLKILAMAAPARSAESVREMKRSAIRQLPRSQSSVIIRIPDHFTCDPRAEARGQSLASPRFRAI